MRYHVGVTESPDDVLQPQSRPRIARSTLELDRAAFLASSGVSEQLISQTSRSLVLLVPDPNVHGVARPTFPSGTDEFLVHLRDVFGSDVDIATTDEEYAEVSLHEDLLILPTILTSLALSVVGNAIWDWIKLRLGKRISKTRVKGKFVSLDASDTRLRVLEYDGPAEQFLDALNRADPSTHPGTDDDVQDT